MENEDVNLSFCPGQVVVRIKRHCTCRIAWPMAVCNDLATLLPECACTLAILLTKAVLISTRKRSPAFSISEALWVTQLRRQAQEYLVTLCSHSHKSQGGAPEPPHLRSSTKSWKMSRSLAVGQGREDQREQRCQRPRRDSYAEAYEREKGLVPRAWTARLRSPWW